MRKTIRKCFWAWDFDKEEQWLNEMAAQGLALVAVGFFTYTFEECAPGEYTFRLELLENMPAHTESQRYIHFIEDTGAQYIGSVIRWVYFRRNNELGSFDLYCDYRSQIKHLRLILTLICIIGCVNIPNGIYMIKMALTHGSPFSLICGLILWSLIGLMGFGFVKVLGKKRELQKEQNLFE